MKTPREILLNRHQAAQTKLDRIRQNVVAEVTRQETSAEDGPSPRELPLLAAAALKLWRELILPCPRAWAGLAAVWLVIFAINLSLRDKSETVAQKTPPPSPELIMALRQQERLLAELIGPRETPAAERPDPFLPRPRSERRDQMLMA